MSVHMGEKMEGGLVLQRYKRVGRCPLRGWWWRSRPLLSLDWALTDEPDLAVCLSDVEAGPLV